MAAISSAPAAATALTPPTSSHGETAPWQYRGDGPFENATHDKAGAAARLVQGHRLPQLSQNGNGPSPPAIQPNSHGFEMAARKTPSLDTAHAAALSPPLAVEARTGRASPSDWPMHNKQHNAADDGKRPLPPTSGLELRGDDSKWIHRDKLAKIESEELQAAGIFVPRSRPPSKQKPELSQSRLARATESADMGHTHGGGRPRKSSVTVEQLPSAESSPSLHHWDLRTPEEIAEEEAKAAYFIPNGAQGGSRIPVAKTSLAPIPLDCLERGSQAVRNYDSAEPDSASARKQTTENPDADAISYSKPRPRSASLSVSDQASTATTGPHPAAGRRSVTDTSPRKNTPRKSSIASRTSSSTGKSKTRTGPNRDSPSTRPTTRAGEPSGAISKAPEGDPPWMLNSYKPDPRLPPDQQLLPTVAKRLQQEKWEKEGKFGDAYDKEFRPLNDKELCRQPPEPDKDLDNNDNNITNQTEEEKQKQSDEWPLKQGATRSPTARQGSYSTMPRILDKPLVRPMTPTPRAPVTQQPMLAAQLQDAQPVLDVKDDSGKKGGCGCCVVM